MQTIELTEEELAALRNMIEQWHEEGFAAGHYTDAELSVFAKLGVT